MKKTYFAPDAEKIEYNYSEAVVACSPDNTLNEMPETLGSYRHCQGCDEKNWHIDAATGICKRN